MDASIKYLIFLTTAVFVIVDSQITYGCSRQPESPCSRHTLECKSRDGDFIALDESSADKIAYGRNNHNQTCPPDQMEICNATCCRHNDVNEYVKVNQTERLSVYRTCSNQPTCTVTSPYNPDAGYDYVRYPYICVPGNQLHNVVEITDVSFLYKGYLYYAGKTQTTSTTITRCCNITSTDILTIQSVYIDLTKESSYNVKIYSHTQTSLLNSVDGGGIFMGFGEVSSSADKIYYVILDNLTVVEDDYIWLRINSSSQTTHIICDDCLNTNITSDDCPNSNITSDDCPNTKITCDGDCPPSSSSNKLGIIIGCVVGVLVIVLIVVIVVVYCIIRRRRRGKSGDDHQELEYTNNNRGESEYDTIQDGDTGHQHRYCAAPQRITPDFCDPCDSCIKLEPRSDPRTPTLDSKVTYNEVKPKNPRRQGEGKPSEYDNISTMTTTVNMEKEEPLETNYDHFKHNSLTPVVKDKTYYDHIPKCDANPRPEHYSDPTYDHLGEKRHTKNPQQDNAVSLNQTSNTNYQPQTPKAKVGDPYTDPTYNHLRVKDPIRQPQRENTAFPKPASHYTYQPKKTVDEPYGDPTYNHLNVKAHTTKPQQENVADPDNDPTYNHLGEKDSNTKPQQENRTKKNNF